MAVGVSAGTSRLPTAVAVTTLAAVIAAAGWLLMRSSANDSDEAWAMLDTYCVDCHNAQEWTADIAFDTMQPEDVADHPAVFERAVRKLRGRMMPPPGERLPSAAQYERLIGWLEATLDALAAEAPRPGYVGVRRLNRAEYANAIEDLFDLQVDVAELLPKDDESDGFENIANVLSESPSFVDQYVSAARVVADKAVGNADTKFEARAYYARGETNQTRHDAGMPLGTRGGIAARHYFPVDGVYRFTADGLVTGDYVPGLEFRHTVVLVIDDELVFTHEVGGEDDLRQVDQQLAPAIAALSEAFRNIEVPVSAGYHDVALSFVARSFAESDETLHPFIDGTGEHPIMMPRRLEIAGPLSISSVGDTPSRRRIFVCRPDEAAQEAACARQILAIVARRAFRRPVGDADLNAPMAFYARARATATFEDGIRSGLLAVLVSPSFLFRGEPPRDGAQSGDVYALNDLELASRLSFFLWSRLPDDELLQLAERGELGEPQVLEAQIQRMLRDSRAHSLIDNFATQWLELREIERFNPDPALFPSYDIELRNAAATELSRFLASVLLENRSVLDLLDADHTYVNERLALHYGLSDVQGDRFRRVTLEDPNRWGLLGKAGVLMLTSYPNRTTPVLRGAWVLNHLIGSPPAAPPPNVEAFPESEEGQPALTVRARLENHRRNPSCNGCHGVIDPLGFALENFDAIGQWRDRDRDAGDVIDSLGRLTDGTTVSSARTLSEAIAAQPELLVQTLTEKLMTYALGRRLDHYDMPAVREIVRQAAADDYRFYSIVAGIVASDAFRFQQVTEN